MSQFKTKEKDSLPHEKCLRYGAATLTDAELLAILIRSGTAGYDCLCVAEKLLQKSGGMGLLGLMHDRLPDYLSVPGIGEVKAVQLLCVAEISKRIVRASRQNIPVFHNPCEIAQYYMEEMRHLEKEQLRLVCLDTKSKLIRDDIISVGTVNYTCLSPREIYKEALSCGAVSIVLLHNHPSGDPTPSKEDIVATKRIQEAGLVIGVPLMDHLVIGDKLYISMKEEAYF